MSPILVLPFILFAAVVVTRLTRVTADRNCYKEFWLDSRSELQAASRRAVELREQLEDLGRKRAEDASFAADALKRLEAERETIAAECSALAERLKHAEQSVREANDRHAADAVAARGWQDEVRRVLSERDRLRELWCKTFVRLQATDADRRENHAALTEVAHALQRLRDGSHRARAVEDAQVAHANLAPDAV